MNLLNSVRVFSKDNPVFQPTDNQFFHTIVLCLLLDSSRRTFLEELDMFLSGDYYYERPQELLLATIMSGLLPRSNREALAEGLARCLKAVADCCARDGTDLKLSLLSFYGKMGRLGLLGEVFVQVRFDPAALFVFFELGEKLEDKRRDELERCARRRRLSRAFTWGIGCDVSSVCGTVIAFSLLLCFLCIAVGILSSEAADMGRLASISNFLREQKEKVA
jgi:hypothetical protein